MRGQPELIKLPVSDYPQHQPIATYEAREGSWVDVREAKPRCRVRVDKGAAPLPVRVFEGGVLDAPDGVEVDYYDDWPAMRDEEIL